MQYIYKSLTILSVFFLCLCSMLYLHCKKKSHPLQQTETCIIECVEKLPNGNRVLSFHSPKDVIFLVADYYSHNYTEDHFKKTRISKTLNQALAEQDYVAVFILLKQEPDKNKRMAWLRVAAEQGHALCMLELSKELDKLNINKTDAQCEEVILWCQRGFVCASLAIVCHQDRSVTAALETLRMAYGNTVSNQIRHHMEKRVGIAHRSPSCDALADYDKYRSHVKERIRQNSWISNLYLNKVIAWAKEIKHPDPTWIGWHGLAKYYGGLQVYPKDSWEERRRQYLDKRAADLEQTLAKGQNKKTTAQDT